MGLEFDLKPLWEAFSGHAELKDQAAAIKAYLEEKWGAELQAVLDAINADKGEAENIYMEKGFKQKCGIQSVLYNQFMFVSGWKYNTDRRYALFWGTTSFSQPESEEDMYFEIVGFGDYAGIRNVKENNWLYAGGPKLNTDRRYVLGWGRSGDPTSEVDMKWYIKDYGGYVGIKNIQVNEWMYAGPELNTGRRHALTWGRTGDPPENPDMQMKIKIITNSKY